jgi:plastocyanin
MRAFVSLLAILAGVSASGSALAQSPPPTVPSAAPSPAVVVQITNFAYSPATVTIAVNQSVRWVENDAMAHTVTAADGSFDSGNLDQGATWTHTFTAPGTYAYVCSYHSFMKGTVIVK